MYTISWGGVPGCEKAECKIRKYGKQGCDAIGFLVNRSQLGFELIDFHLRVGHFLLLGLEV
jgi:hypothetical protein